MTLIGNEVTRPTVGRAAGWGQRHWTFYSPPTRPFRNLGRLLTASEGPVGREGCNRASVSDLSRSCDGGRGVRALVTAAGTPATCQLINLGGDHQCLGLPDHYFLTLWHPLIIRSAPFFKELKLWFWGVLSHWVPPSIQVAGVRARCGLSAP